ncbi:DUF6344 domain-containing protein [Streptomyces sp. AC555_RSS877]|uniref:DUF6344 domain-containing protein n=1 Tax=Streptomyces sp. AC555_RSS877 TaxID=2823688 RepID=UPI001C27C0D0|nr:DUF6344 domain-containing protein [Streptomyces sp. AC555_RSS877]
MARNNKVMKLWTAIVTAFLALCTTLGLITTTAAAAVPQTEKTRNSTAPTTTTTPATPLWSWSWSCTSALPPTMKQRIHAEAHGKTPSCRHRPSTDTEADESAESSTESGPDAAPAAPLRR